jgi:hypothetical protein
MNITISNLKVIDTAVNKRLKAMEPVFKESLTTEKNRIQERTQRGLGANLRKFKGYSESWAAVRKSKGLPTSYVDLTFTGDMFNAFKVSFSKGANAFRGVLNFGSEGWKVAKNERLGREFFQLRPSQIETIKTKLRQVS